MGAVLQWDARVYVGLRTGTFSLGGGSLWQNTTTQFGQGQITAHLPLTAVDLHATMPTVAYFPAKVVREKPQEEKVLQPVFLSKMKAKFAFKATEASHYALRNYLTVSSEDNPPSYAAVRECFAVTRDGADKVGIGSCSCDDHCMAMMAIFMEEEDSTVDLLPLRRRPAP